MAKSNPRAAISRELRWFLSAGGLLNRQDRDEAILDRAAQMPSRIRSAEEALDALSDAPADILAGCEKDMAQIMDLNDAIVQRAKTIERRAAGGTPLRPTMGQETHAITGRLPTLALTSFGGKVEDWVAFRNMFTSLVDTRADLSPGQKMAYLVSSLQGEARLLVQHLRVEDGQYDTAWELLNARYQNVRMLADAHVAQLLALPRVGSQEHLRHQLITPLVVACNALRTLGLPVDEWSFLLVHIVLSKLPRDSRSRFERQQAEREHTELPKFVDLLKFLEHEARASETTNQEPGWQVGSRGGGPSRGGNRVDRPTQSARAPRVTSMAVVTGDGGCPHCKGAHTLGRCRQWQELPVQERRRFVKRIAACFGCLGSHYARDCPRAQPCSGCGGPHHQMLCMNRSGSPAILAVPRTTTPTGGGVPARGTRPPAGRCRVGRPHGPQGAHARKAQDEPALGASEGPTLPYYGWQGHPVAGPSEGGPSTGGGAIAAARVGSPVLDQRGPVAPRFSPPIHEYPRLEYHPPYYQLGRAAGYTPPRLMTCTRGPYFSPPARGRSSQL